MNDLELEMEKKRLRDLGCGWKDGKYHKGAPEQEVRKKELSCIEMINSILAYDCRGYADAKEVLKHDYLADCVTELGEVGVLELIQGQIDSIDYVHVAVSYDSEGLSYNSIQWKVKEI